MEPNDGEATKGEQGSTQIEIQNRTRVRMASQETHTAVDSRGVAGAGEGGNRGRQNEEPCYETHIVSGVDSQKAGGEQRERGDLRGHYGAR